MASLVYLISNHRMQHTRIILVVLFLFVLFTTPVMNRHSTVGEIMSYCGYFMVIACVLGRAFCTLFIGGVKDSQLVTSGPYAMCRNPLYLFSFLGAVGLGLQSGMLLLAAFIAGTYLLYYQVTIRNEEQFLSQQFGQAYQNYLKSVPRLFPKHWRFSLAKDITVCPKLVFKTILDSSLFFLAMPFFALVDRLQQLELLPTLFHLY